MSRGKFLRADRREAILNKPPRNGVKNNDK
jgi:hypothetical protein